MIEKLIFSDSWDELKLFYSLFPNSLPQMEKDIALLKVAKKLEFLDGNCNVFHCGKEGITTAVVFSLFTQSNNIVFGDVPSGFVILALGNNIQNLTIHKSARVSPIEPNKPIYGSDRSTYKPDIVILHNNWNPDYWKKQYKHLVVTSTNTPSDKDLVKRNFQQPFKVYSLRSKENEIS